MGFLNLKNVIRYDLFDDGSLWLASSNWLTAWFNDFTIILISDDFGELIKLKYSKFFVKKLLIYG